MSRGDWSRHVALIGALLATIFVLCGALAYTFHVGELSGRKDAEAEGYAAAYLYETNKQIADCWAKGDTPAAQQCVTSAIQASRDAQRSEADLGVQRQMSDWAFWALVVGIVMAFITTIGTYLIFRQVELTRKAVEDTGDATKAMEEANRIARESIALTHRAWLTVELSENAHFSAWQNAHHYTVDFGVFLSNTGNGIAKSLEISSKLYVVCADFDPSSGVNNWGRYAEPEPLECNSHKFPAMINPGDVQIPADGSGMAESIDAAHKLYVLTTVEYRDIFARDDEPSHISEAFYQVVIDEKSGSVVRRADFAPFGSGDRFTVRLTKINSQEVIRRNLIRT